MTTVEPRLVTLPHLTTSDVLAASPGDRTPRPQQRLTVPIPAAPTVCRERVLRLLEEAVRRPVTLVTGGAGCGKTVAVSDWASQHRAAEATVWVSLTRLEADAYAVGTHIAASEELVVLLGAEPPDYWDAGASAAPDDDLGLLS